MTYQIDKNYDIGLIFWLTWFMILVLGLFWWAKKKSLFRDSALDGPVFGGKSTKHKK